MALLSNAGIISFDENAYNNPLWYVGVLLVCYVVFWFSVNGSLSKRIGRGFIYGFLVLLGLGLRSYETSLPFLNEDTARGLVPFFVGCLLYFCYEKVGKRTGAIISLSLIIIFAAAYSISRKDFIDDLQMILIFLVYPSLIMFLLDSTVVNLLFNHRFFGELGKISFEMYIWHVPVFSLIKLMAALGNLPMPSTFQAMIIIALSITAVSAIMYYVIEKPLTKRLLSGRSNKLIEGA